MVEELDFCFVQENSRNYFKIEWKLCRSTRKKTFDVLLKHVQVDQVTLDLGSGLGVTVPSTLLFILLFTSGLGAIPGHIERESAVKWHHLKENKAQVQSLLYNLPLELLAMFGPIG